MKATITSILLLAAILASAQCTTDTTRYETMYEWVLCIDHSYVSGQVETSADPEVFSMKASVMPAVVIANVAAVTETVRTDCGDESWISSRLYIRNNPQYEPIDWKAFADMSESVRFEEVQEPAIEVPVKRASYGLRR